MNLQKNFKRGVERKHIKVTDLWPKNAPNHIPLNYRHQGRAAKEAQPFYCGNSAHTLKYIFTLPLKFDSQPTGKRLNHDMSLFLTLPPNINFRVLFFFFFALLKLMNMGKPDNGDDSNEHTKPQVDTFHVSEEVTFFCHLVAR